VRAFTLFELLVSIVVITVLMSFTGMSFLNYSSDGAKLRRSQDLIQAMVEAARMEARASRSAVSLMYKKEEGVSFLTMAKVDAAGGWQPIIRWSRLSVEIENNNSYAKYPNAFVKSNRIEFDSDGAVLTDELGVNIILVAQDKVIENEADVRDSKRVFVSKLTGKSIVN